MALSTAQKRIHLFMILRVPLAEGSNAGTYNTMNNLGSLSMVTTLDPQTRSRAVSAIDTWITNMNADAITELEVLLDRHIALGTNKMQIEGGALDDINNVTIDKREELMEIRERVKCLVPFFNYNEVLERQAGIEAGGGFQMMGGR